MKNDTIVQNIAIANGFCAVTKEMRLSCIANIARFETEVNGFKAYRINNVLYLVARGKDAWTDVDKVNGIYGEENVAICDFNAMGCIFVIKNTERAEEHARAHKEQIYEQMHDMAKQRLADAVKRMDNMPMCSKLYNDMCKEGYGEQMQVFKNLVLCTTLLYPNKSDEDIFFEIYSKIALR